MVEKDYFRVLGIDRDSGPEEIKRAYRELAFRYHPDTAGGGKETAERFREIRKAYDVLSDTKQRNQHQEEPAARKIPVRRRPFPAGAAGDFSENRCFRSNSGPLRGRDPLRQGRPPGGRFFRPSGLYAFADPAVCDLTLTRAEARNGTERVLRIEAHEATFRVTVEIPAGVEDGSLLEVVGPRTRGLGIHLLLRARVLD
jgi:DnaJ-class molecular chaperone